MEDRRFCVYFHRNTTNNEIFYIGKGTIRRAHLKHGRSNKWKNYVASNGGGFNVEIFKNELTTTEALELERTLLYSGEYPSVVNIMKSHVTLPNLLEIVDNFYYDETSPTCLRWKTDRKSGKYSQVAKVKAGDVAGWFKKDQGYFEVGCNGRSYKCHRLVWVLHNNIEVPVGMVINHIDCDRGNNKVSNLEVVSTSQNNKKAKHHINKDVVISSNNSGVTGVSLRGGKYPSWFSRFSTNEGRFAKSFSIDKYGYDRAFEMAVAFRKQMEELYYK